MEVLVCGGVFFRVVSRRGVNVIGDVGVIV